jgi:hypothetical protein
MANYRTYVLGSFNGVLPWSFGMKWTGSITEGAVNLAWASAVTNLVNGTSPTGIAAFMSTDVLWTSVYTTTVNATWHQTTKTPASLSGVAGTGTAASLPWRMAPIVRFTTALANRRGRGRVHLPAYGTNEMAAHGVMLAATQTATEVAFEAMRQAMISAGLTQVTFGTKVAKDGTPPFTLTTVTGIAVPNTFGSVRKRDHKLSPTTVIGP